VIPHGIYDLTHNLGFITLGNSRDTAEFACDSLWLWWAHQGQYLYPDAHSLLIFCDGGGSNSPRHYEKGRKVTDDFKNKLPIIFDDFLSQWNYRAVPSS
jgi:hypothetical protein